MFFWNVTALKAELVRSPLSQRASLKYLIATVGVLMLLYELDARIAVTRTPMDTVASAAGLIIMLFGTLVTYAANGGDGGHDFLGRYFALAWVVGIRNFAGLIAAMVAVGVVFAASSLDSLDSPGPFDTAGAILTVVFAGLFYWRMAVHIREVAFASTQTTSSAPTVAS